MCAAPNQETEAPSPERLDWAKAARLRQALTAGSEELLDLLHDPDPEVLRNTLKNPYLNEEHLLIMLKRRALPEQVFKPLQRHPLVGRCRRVKMALAAHPDTPASLLSTILSQLLLFELVTLMQRPDIQADLKLAAERAVLKRLPETELGSKIALARRAPSGILAALLKEGQPRLVEAVLANPRLKEAGVHAFLSSPAADAETISAVARHPRWAGRANLRFAMLRNPRTPAIWFTLFLPALPDLEVEALLYSKSLEPRQLAAVREEWENRRRR